MAIRIPITTAAPFVSENIVQLIYFVSMNRIYKQTWHYKERDQSAISQKRQVLQNEYIKKKISRFQKLSEKVTPKFSPDTRIWSDDTQTAMI